MKFLILNENLGHKKLEVDDGNVDKNYIKFKVSELYNIDLDTVRLARLDPDFNEYITMESDSEFKELQNLDKIKLTVIEQPLAKVLAEITVPVPPAGGGAANLPVMIVPSSDAEDTDADSSLNISTSTEMNDR